MWSVSLCLIWRPGIAGGNNRPRAQPRFEAAYVAQTIIRPITECASDRIQQGCANRQRQRRHNGEATGCGQGMDFGRQRSNSANLGSRRGHRVPAPKMFEAHRSCHRVSEYHGMNPGTARFGTATAQRLWQRRQARFECHLSPCLEISIAPTAVADSNTDTHSSHEDFGALRTCVFSASAHGIDLPDLCG